MAVLLRPELFCVTAEAKSRCVRLSQVHSASGQTPVRDVLPERDVQPHQEEQLHHPLGELHTHAPSLGRARSSPLFLTLNLSSPAPSVPPLLLSTSTQRRPPSSRECCTPTRPRGPPSPSCRRTSSSPAATSPRACPPRVSPYPPASPWAPPRQWSSTRGARSLLSTTKVMVKLKKNKKLYLIEGRAAGVLGFFLRVSCVFETLNDIISLIRNREGGCERRASAKVRKLLPLHPSRK